MDVIGMKMMVAFCLALAAFAGRADACSPIGPSMVFFAFQSIELHPSSEKYTLNSLKERFGKVNPKCVQFRIKAYSDVEEGRTSDKGLAMLRAAAIKRRLLASGFLAESIQVTGTDGRDILIPNVPPGTSDLQNRIAYIETSEP